VADEQQPSKGPSFTSTIAKRALAPIVASAATAITAYLMRKGAEVWEQKLRPMIEEKGGGRAVARDTLETAAEKVGGPASEQLGALAEKLDDEGTAKVKRASARAKDSAADAGREEERRQREQRRKKRRQALEQTRST
jgi:hypothetical protein